MKRIGRARRRLAGPALPPPESAREEKRVGSARKAETPGTSRAHRHCDHCNGRIRYGNWLHDPGCAYTAVIWDYEEREDWPCPFGCAPVHLATCRTHSWSCAFWDSPFNSRDQVGFEFDSRAGSIQDRPR